MTVCKLAGIPVAFQNRYRYFPYLVQDYLTAEPPLLTVTLSEEEILREEHGGRALPGSLSPDGRMAYLEALAFYRKLSAALPRLGGFFLHAALLEVDGEGIAITAASGVGKSTHAALWRDLLPGRCRILNGDKPLVRRMEDGRFYGFGTPFAGKEGWQTNASAPIRALLLLERGETDRLTPLSAAEAFPTLYAATLAPGDPEAAALLLPLLGEFLEGVRILRASVTKHPSAAVTAYQTIFGKELPL